MWNDEIVEEVHRVREEYAAKFRHDIDAIYHDILRRQAESNREFVSFSRRPVGQSVLKPTDAKRV